MPDHPAEAPEVDLAAIRARWLHGAWADRLPIEGAVEIQQLCNALEVQAERLAQWEQLAAKKNWHYVHDRRYDEMVLEKIRAENERSQARAEAAEQRDQLGRIARILDLALPSEQTGPEWDNCARVPVARLEAIDAILAESVLAEPAS